MATYKKSSWHLHIFHYVYLTWDWDCANEFFHEVDFYSPSNKIFWSPQFELDTPLDIEETKIYKKMLTI